ncbi:hypothetical protein M3Y94_00302900 [Aphelenchoides besseyi]|nr:hypothetical protein M3Y94_00302900 [Aphelenchoides besseyi]KAI6235813.1 hypothetical protein M3Y95_00091200 [Aphelenchoides besseyi]
MAQVEDEEKLLLERFALSFEYYFQQLYAASFPRNIMLQRLNNSIDTLFRLTKSLKDNEAEGCKTTTSLWETCQSITSVNNHVISPARKRLLKLLDNTMLQNLFLAYDEISNYSSDLPAADSDQYNRYDLPVKIVNILKGSDPLGATIKSHPNGEIYIARVIAGGAADRCGSIHPGDQILECNGIPVTFKHPSEVVQILANNTDGIVSFTLVPRQQLSHKVHMHSIRKHYVRAHFDYVGNEDELQPCREAALNFQNGDILEVISGDDPFWQQARCISHGSLITFDLSTLRPSSNAEPSTSESTFADEDSQLLQVGIIPTELVLRRQVPNKMSVPLPDVFYEPVAVMEPQTIRTIVLIGAPGVGRSELKKRLISFNPMRYATPCPHTSRPQRSNERHGVDYYFCSRNEMENAIAAGRFVEYGAYNDNLYGTMDQSILNLIKEGKTPIVNAHPFSLRILRSARFKPIVIFVEPPNFTLFKKTRMAAGARSSFTGRKCFTDYDFAATISNSAQLSLTYGRFTDFRIVNGVLDETLVELTRVLHDYETRPSWVPAKWLDGQ